MKKNVTILNALLGACFAIAPLQAQKVSKQVLQKYPSCATRVYQVAAAVPLTDSKQEQLAALFFRSDSAFAAGLTSRGTPNMAQLQQNERNAIRKTLSPQELNLYYDALAAGEATLQTKASMQSILPRIKEREYIAPDLEKAYYARHLQLAKLHQATVTSSFDAEQELVIVARHDSILSRILFRGIIGGRGLYLLTAPYYQKELGLTDAQVEKLIDRGLEKIRITDSGTQPEGYDASTFERSYMQQVMTPAQYKAFFVAINRTLAHKGAIAGWQLLKQWKLTSPYDSATAVKQMDNYLLQQNAITSEYRTDNTTQKEKLDALFVPDPMAKVLIIQKTNTDKSMLADAFLLRRKLKIIPPQLDTIKILSDNFRSLVVKNKLEGNTAFNQDEYERTNLMRLLDEVQYDNLLKLRNSAPAMEEATATWGKLKSYGLVEAKDSAKVFTDVFFYHFNLRVAKDRYVADPVHQKANVDAINEKKPAIIKELSIAQKTGTVKDVKAYRGTIAW